MSLLWGVVLCLLPRWRPVLRYRRGAGRMCAPVRVSGVV